MLECSIARFLCKSVWQVFEDNQLNLSGIPHSVECDNIAEDEYSTYVTLPRAVFDIPISIYCIWESWCCL